MKDRRGRGRTDISQQLFKKINSTFLQDAVAALRCGTRGVPIRPDAPALAMSSSLTHWTKKDFGRMSDAGLSVCQPRTHEFNDCLSSVYNDALLVICTRYYEVDHITYWRVYASECDR